MSSNKKIVALILCIFLGYLGVHRFYLKKIGSGIFYLFTAGGFAIGWIVDIILIATGKMSGLEVSASGESPVKNNQIVVDGIPLDHSFSASTKSEAEEDQRNENREPMMLPHLPFTPNDNDPAPTAKQLNYLHDLRVLVPVGISKYDASALISRVTDGDFECPTPDMVAIADGLGVEYSAFIGKDAMFEHIVYSCGHEKRAALYAYCVDCSLKNMQISNMFSSPRLKIYFDFAAIVKNDNGLLKSLSERLPSDFQQPNKNTNIYKACRDYLLTH